MAFSDYLHTLLLRFYPEVVDVVDRIQDNFIRKYLMPLEDALPNPHIFYAELLGRCVQSQVNALLRKQDVGANWSRVNIGLLWQKEVKKDSRISTTIRKQLRFIQVSLEDVKRFRKWMNRQNLKMLVKQTNGHTWKAYQLYDPVGERQMSLYAFSNLFPEEWRAHFNVINGSYRNCQLVNDWLEIQDLNQCVKQTENSIWELYKMFDPKGQYKMNMGSFSSMLPPEWKQHYSKMEGRYEIYQRFDQWQANQSLGDLLNQTKGSTWELYNLFDPKHQFRMNQGFFYSLLPPLWRKQFSSMYSPYQDCVDISNWIKTLDFDEVILQTKGSSWLLYQIYDPEGKRKMNIGNFYTLLPSQWRESHNSISLSFEDCFNISQWIETISLEKTLRLTDGSTWQLYKLFDPEGKKGLHLGNFHSCLPIEWRESFPRITAKFEHCHQFEKWAQDQRIKELLKKTQHSTWKLYLLFDAKGKFKMNLGGFYSLLPTQWKQDFPYIDAPFEVCKVFEKWQARQELQKLIDVTKGSIWELYKRFDSRNKYQLSMGNFYTLLPPLWKPHFSYIKGRQQDITSVENWLDKQSLKELLEKTNGSTWELYKQFDEKGLRQMNQIQFYTMLPEDWKFHFYCIHGTYDDCVHFEQWHQKLDLNTLIELTQRSLAKLYQLYDTEGKRKMNLGHFYTLLPEDWKKHFPRINASYDDWQVFDQWIKQQDLANCLEKTHGSTWELYKCFAQDSQLNMTPSAFSSLLPPLWRKHFMQLSVPYQHCLDFEKWSKRQSLEKLVDKTKGSTWKLYKLFDRKGDKNLNLDSFYTLLSKDWKALFPYLKISIETGKIFDQWIYQSEIKEPINLLHQRFEKDTQKKIDFYTFRHLIKFAS